MSLFGEEDPEHPTRWRAVTLAGIGVFLLCAVSIGISVLIIYLTGAMCDSCGTPKHSSSYDKVTKEYQRVVEAFSHQSMDPDQHVCWSRDFDDDDTPDTWVMFDDNAGTLFPMKSLVQGRVCYAIMVVPGPNSVLYGPTSRDASSSPWSPSPTSFSPSTTTTPQSPLTSEVEMP